MGGNISVCTSISALERNVIIVLLVVALLFVILLSLGYRRLTSGDDISKTRNKQTTVGALICTISGIICIILFRLLLEQYLTADFLDSPVKVVGGIVIVSAYAAVVQIIVLLSSLGKLFSAIVARYYYVAGGRKEYIYYMIDEEHIICGDERDYYRNKGVYHIVSVDELCKKNYSIFRVGGEENVPVELNDTEVDGDAVLTRIERFGKNGCNIRVKSTYYIE